MNLTNKGNKMPKTANKQMIKLLIRDIEEKLQFTANDIKGIESHLQLISDRNCSITKKLEEIKEELK